ncbi:MAG: desulfoferrodoxin [bacterium]
MVKNRLEVYKCLVCGNIVEVLHVGGGELVCCGKPMELQAEKTADQGKEKHVPVIEKTDKGILVKVGSIPHPMEDKHYIEWVELIADGNPYIKFLKPEAAPEALFEIKANDVSAREFCTVHGLWRA